MRIEPVDYPFGTPTTEDAFRVRGVRELLDGVEARWRDEVGPQRYAVFRDVLTELVHGAGG